jgi:hypothetical protein
MATLVIHYVCAQHSASLATRKVDDFDGLELNLINPWSH